MSCIKTLKLYNNIPQEFNLASLKARGCLQEMYKINEKMNSVSSQIDLINKMKNSDKITEEIYDSMDNNNKIIKIKKPKIKKLNRFDVNIVKFIRDKDTNLFINEERVRMNKAIESLQKINNYFKKNNQVSYSNKLGVRCLKANRSDIDLIKINPNKGFLSPLKLDKKIKFKLNNKSYSVNKKNDSNTDNNKNENSSLINESNNKFEFRNNSNNFFSNYTTLPKISLSPLKERTQDSVSLNVSKKKSKFINTNKSGFKNENEKLESENNEIGFNSASEDSKSIISEDEENDKKIITQKINNRRKSVFMKENKLVNLNNSDIFLNDIKKRRRHSCIDISQFKIILYNLNGTEESDDDKHKNFKKCKKEEKEKSDMTILQNDAISPIFPDDYKIKKYFASPIERLKNIYSFNFDKKKLILPKI